MLRAEALKAVYDRLEKVAVVTIMGAVAAELQSSGPPPHIINQHHALGLATSMGRCSGRTDTATPRRMREVICATAARNVGGWGRVPP